MAASPRKERDVQTYTVHKKVADFATNEDLSTPEAAYATCNRAYAAEGIACFKRLSEPGMAERMPPTKPKALSEKQTKELLQTEVVEVNLAAKEAAAFAKVPHPLKNIIDVRYFELQHGRWLNTGNDVFGDLESARKKFSRILAAAEAKRKIDTRPPVINPAEYLRPFVDFLRREAADPQHYTLKALAQHRILIMGEVHHRPRYWDFNASLVRAKEFANHARVIYMELPSNDQHLVEEFLASSKYDPKPIIEMLRDNLWTGWPDQAMLEFFKAVWDANQALSKEQRLRIVLVDMERPWKQITRREDWRKYDVDRDQFMADKILSDLRKDEAGHALFIVGYGHAMVNLTRPSGEPMKAAGWHLRQKLGESNVFAVFPHSPVISNMGDVKGRIALGLFETAFAELGNRPMMFPLEHGPFGEQIFDASMDEPTSDIFRNGYQAYLHLGPLENETFSTLIPDFYTDEFAKELDRRHRILFGKGLESEGIRNIDGKSFVKWMSTSWGQPRTQWSGQSLGPLRAWELGSDWEKHTVAAKLDHWQDYELAIRHAATALLNAIQHADYANPGDWRHFPPGDADYQVYTDYPSWMRWVCEHFRTNPIVGIELGALLKHTNGLPTLPYKLALQNGSKLEGLLPMKYSARSDSWFGTEGLDWHLRSALGAASRQKAAE